MKLSEHTLSVLKNFSSINSSLVIHPGKIQKTISANHTILVEAVLEDDFSTIFGVYDLNQFLGNITTLNKPDLDFSDKSVVMDDGETSLKYYACSPSLILAPPRDKELTLPKIDADFVLKQDTLNKLLRLANMNNLSHLTIVGKDGELRIQTHDKTNDTSNIASSKISDYEGKDFAVSFKTENLRVIPDEYHIQISVGSFSKWKNKDGNLTYFIALETK